MGLCSMSCGISASSGYNGARRDLEYLTHAGLGLLHYAYTSWLGQAAPSEKDEHYDYQQQQAHRAQHVGDVSRAPGSQFWLQHSPIVAPPRRDPISLSDEEYNPFSDSESDENDSDTSSLASFVRREATVGISYVRTRSNVSGYVDSQKDPAAVAALFGEDDDEVSVSSQHSEFSLPSETMFVITDNPLNQLDGVSRLRHLVGERSGSDASHSSLSSQDTHSSADSQSSAVELGSPRCSSVEQTGVRQSPVLLVPTNTPDVSPRKPLSPVVEASDSDGDTNASGSDRAESPVSPRSPVTLLAPHNSFASQASGGAPVVEQLQKLVESSTGDDFVLVQMGIELGEQEEQSAQMFDGWDAVQFEESQDAWGLSVAYQPAKK